MDADDKLIRVTRDTPELASIFLRYGRDYMSNLTVEKKERFLQSILDLQDQPMRWLFLFKWKEEFVGFVHMKIGGETRVGLDDGVLHQTRAS